MEMKTIDYKSPEFQKEVEKTWGFVKKVCESQGWVLSPREDVNEGIVMGLARNKLLFGKRFCPCFMVEPDPEKPGKYRSTDNRICPCKPAVEKEVPQDGICHCQIFCRPDYAEKLKEELEKEKVENNNQ